MVRSPSASDSPRRRLPPATTTEGRENQMINLAIDAAEKQMREGTASAQVITHYLKLGATTTRLEQEKLRQQIELDKAKVKALGSEEDMKKVYEEALRAMKTYSGNGGN